MAEHGPPLTAEEAKRAVKGYGERAGKATAALKAMLGRTEHDARVETIGTATAARIPMVPNRYSRVAGPDSALCDPVRGVAAGRPGATPLRS